MTVLIVIGKILLTILLILICLLLIILFDPIRYEADVGIDSKSVAVRVQWLFGLIRFRFHYRDGPQAEIRLLWKRVDLLNPKPKKEKEKRRFLLGRNHSGKKKKPAVAVETESARTGEQVPNACLAETTAEISSESAGAADQTGEYAADTGDGSQIESAAGTEFQGSDTGFEPSAAGKQTGPEAGYDSPPAGEEGPAAAETKKPAAEKGKAGDAERKESAAGNVDSSETVRTSKKRKLPFTGRNHKKAGNGVSDTAGKVKSVVGKFKTILGMVSEYHVLDSVWPRLTRLVSHILPRRISGSISFGLSDPGTTGTITGIIAVIPLFYETELEINPDFEAEQNYIRGHFDAAGRILLIWVVVLIIGLILDKPFRQFIGKLRKEWQSF